MANPLVPTGGADWEAQDQTWVSDGNLLRFRAVSSALPDKCRENPTWYLVTPPISQGGQLVKEGNSTLAATPEQRLKYAGNLYSEIILPCSHLRDVETIEWEAYTETYTLARLNSWPTVVPKPPVGSVFRTTMVAIGMGGLVSTTFLGLILFLGKIPKNIMLCFALGCLLSSIAFWGWIPTMLGVQLPPLTVIKIADAAIWLSLVFCTRVFLYIDGTLRTLYVYATYLTLFAVALVLVSGNLDQLQVGSNLAIATQLTFIATFFVQNIINLFRSRRYSGFIAWKAIASAIYAGSQINDMLLIGNYIDSVPIFPLGVFSVTLIVVLLVNRQVTATYTERDLLKVKVAKETAIAHLAQQVAHDIRSPIASLNLLEAHMGALPEPIRIATRSAITRIKDIANTMSKKARSEHLTTGLPEADVAPVATPKESRPILLSAQIESLLSEKRIEHQKTPGLEIAFSPDPDALYSFSSLDPTEFARAISNLINNAIEAVGASGRVEVSLRRLTSTPRPAIEITLSDNGSGIPSEILNRLGQRGVTHGKSGSTSGSGLGVWHAKTTIEGFGGTITFQSQTQGPNPGTRVTVTLPETEPPPWFCDALTVKPEMTVVVLDDDDYIHTLWRERFNSPELASLGIKLVHFTGPTELSDYAFVEGSRTNHLYLLDHDLIGHKVTGLKLIEGLGLNTCSVLVTSRYEQPEIQAKCEQLGVKILPKTLAHGVLISGT